MATLVNIGLTRPSGTGATIPVGTAGLGAAAAGDFVIAFFGWARSGTGETFSCSDTLGNTWTAVQMNGSSNEAGGYAYSVITTGWASSGNTITGALSSGTPGGRVGMVFKIPSGTLTASPVDQHVEAVSDPSSTPSVTSGTLAQASSLCVGFDLQRASAGTAAFTWGSGWTSDGSETGVGTTASGIFMAEQTVSATTAVTASGTSADAGADHHEMSILVLKLASSTTNLNVGAALNTAAAYGPTVVPGTVTLTMGFPSSAHTAYGPTLVPGSVTLAVGAALSTATAYGPTIVPAILLTLGMATRTASALGPTLVPGTATVLMGTAASSPVADGPTLVPGTVTLVVGEAVRTAQALGPLLVPIISAGAALRTPNALGAVLSPGLVSLGVGVASGSPVARGVSLAPGAVTLTMGAAVHTAVTFGPTLKSLILPSAYPDPWNKVWVVADPNQAQALPSNNIVIAASSANQAVVAPSMNIAIVEE